MSAIRAVIDTTELIEAILLRLDTKTLLLSQRVEKRFHQVINNSKPLQRKLFFLPTTTFDDIINLGFLDTADADKYNILDSTSNRCKWLQQVVILNDIFFDTTREWRLRNISFANPNISESHGHVEPSWKRMLLTQPPPRTGRGDVMFWFEDFHENDELCEDVDTMGQMMKRVYEKENHIHDFNVHWDTAAVRPVKHAVDGTYYLRLLNQRKMEEVAVEEVIEVTVFDGKGNVEEDTFGNEPLRMNNADQEASFDGDDDIEAGSRSPCEGINTYEDVPAVERQLFDMPVEALESGS